MALQRQPQRHFRLLDVPDATDSNGMRTGRHPLILAPEDAPSFVSNLRKVLYSVGRMCYVYAWWDVSWWIAVLFTLGSTLFLIAGCFYWVPTAYPSTAFPGESLLGGGILSFIGATLFAMGGYLLIVEAINARQADCFGWALEHAFFPDQADSGDLGAAKHGFTGEKYLPDPTKCTHHHNGKVRISERDLTQPAPYGRWRWWPTYKEVRTDYGHQIGFLAASIMAVGTLIFWITGLLALPGIYDHLPRAVLRGLYWLTYLIGGTFFVLSSLLYVLEMQVK